METITMTFYNSGRTGCLVAPLNAARKILLDAKQAVSKKTIYSEKLNKIRFDWDGTLNCDAENFCQLIKDDKTISMELRVFDLQIYKPKPEPTDANWTSWSGEESARHLQ